MADCFQGFKNQESIMEKGIYEYIYISAFDDPFENILRIYFYNFFFEWLFSDINNQFYNVLPRPGICSNNVRDILNTAALK